MLPNLSQRRQLLQAENLADFERVLSMQVIEL